MIILDDRIENFKKCCSLIPEMGKHIENGINIDPKTITMKEFAVAGTIDGKVRTKNSKFFVLCKVKLFTDFAVIFHISHVHPSKIYY